MNYKRILKYWLSLVLFLITITVNAQTFYSDSIIIRTGFNYSTGQLYNTSDNTNFPVDDYWVVLLAEGNTLSPTIVGNQAPGAWVEGDSRVEWISNLDDQEVGTFYYRFLFCIDSISSTSQQIIQGVVAADNTIETIRIDGQTVADFSNFAIEDCPGTGSGGLNSGSGRDNDFKCLKSFEFNVSPNLLSNGYHILEYQIYNSGLFSGVVTDAALKGVSGWVLPSSGSNNLTGCTPKGQVRGIVYNDLNLNGIQDSNEGALSSISISLYNTNGLLMTVLTDVDGAYNFYGLDITSTYSIVYSLQSPFNIITEPVNPNYYVINFSGNNFLLANKDFGLGIDNIPPPSCANCIGSFAPEPGKYLVSAWVKEDSAAPTRLTYTHPQIFIQFPTNGIQFPENTATSVSSSTLGPFTAQGIIIDGWQRIEAEFIIPVTAVYINLHLVSDTGTCYFDDIRIFPFNGSMKSYVYDPVNLRLVAELDERNYATIYEYDEEGKLIRVKKETEQGVMTIKENRNSTFKK